MRRTLAGLTLAATAVTLAVYPPPAVAADSAPIGFAAVNALGQNGTTGGTGGPTVTVTNATDFIAAIAATGPRIVRVQGTITLPTGSSDGMYNVSSDKTIVGIGATARIQGGGLNIGLPVDDDVTSPPADAVHNVVIRNLSFSGATDDAINVQMFSHHIWIDHNDLCCGDDGLVDIKRGSDFVTVSWNRTHDHDLNAGLVVENNVFENVNNPGRVDFSGDLGRLVARGNILVDTNHEIEVRGTVVEPRTYYPYTLDAASAVPTIVPAGAGVGKI